MAHDTCRLTAKNRDQLRNPTFGGDRVWATFFNVRRLAGVKSRTARAVSVTRACHHGNCVGHAYRPR